MRSVAPARLRLLLGSRFFVRCDQQGDAQRKTQNAETDQNAVGHGSLMPDLFRCLKFAFIDGRRRLQNGGVAVAGCGRTLQFRLRRQRADSVIEAVLNMGSAYTVCVGAPAAV